MHTGKGVLCLILLWPLLAAAEEAIDPDKILTPTELASMDRENAMWHLLRVDDDVATNIRLLRNRGFTEAEVDLMRPRLAAIWDIDLERNYGWLSKEAIARIQAVDVKFIARLRAVRLFETAGVRIGPNASDKMSGLSREWQRAIQRELDYREISEFRLMNSRSAQEVRRRIKGLLIATDEFRTLCEWQRDFDGKQNGELQPPSSRQRAGRIEDNLDYWARVRSLLGDARFVVYLMQSNADFARMNQAVSRLEGVDSTMVLDLWWMKQKWDIAQVRTTDPMEWRRVKRGTYDSAFRMLGAARFAQYSQDETARWLRN